MMTVKLTCLISRRLNLRLLVVEYPPCLNMRILVDCLILRRHPAYNVGRLNMRTPVHSLNLIHGRPPPPATDHGPPPPATTTGHRPPPPAATTAGHRSRAADFGRPAVAYFMPFGNKKKILFSPDSLLQHIDDYGSTPPRGGDAACISTLRRSNGGNSSLSQ